MNEKDWKRLKTLYKKHVRMAKKIGWRVYKTNVLEMNCPFWSEREWNLSSHGEPPFARYRGRLTHEWKAAMTLWYEGLEEDPARMRREFGWRN